MEHPVATAVQLKEAAAKAECCPFVQIETTNLTGTIAVVELDANLDRYPDGRTWLVDLAGKSMCLDPSPEVAAGTISVHAPKAGG